MRVLIQRVSRAEIWVAGSLGGRMGTGLVALLGIGQEDDHHDIDWLVRKVMQMRLFADAQGAMNQSLLDVDGSILVVSQFTLHARTKKGNRPSFVDAAPPEKSEPLYHRFLEAVRSWVDDSRLLTGVFGAQMEVVLVNDGPVTIWLDSRQRE